MSRERRNLYRILHVQPESPPEVIKAAWRALMSSLRCHPDLGGEASMAARINAAYETLSDPERRAAYDRTLLRTPQGLAGATAKPPPAAAAGPACPFCGQAHARELKRDTRCVACNSPLNPLPPSASQAEMLGRRLDPRFERQSAAEWRQPGDTLMRSGRLLDLSFSGLQLQVDAAVAPGQVLSVATAQFEALVRVVHGRKLRHGHALHCRLLTLALLGAARGVYVSAKA